MSDEHRAADERTTLLQGLDFYREVLRRKASGLDEDQMRARIEPSELTIGGLLVHMAMVEDNWFPRVFAGRPQSEPWASAPWSEDRDWEFHVAAEWSAARIVEEFDAAVARSRAVVDGAGSLDDVAVVTARSGEDMSLRWIVNHMLTEYARHCGHADLLRERIDGTTGD